MDEGGTGDRTLQSQKVYDRLRRDISARRLLPGAVLNEAILSERYDASRTPVREALFKLAQEGFLERVGRQLRVKEFTFADVEELYQLREGLEKMAARLCVERASEADLDALERQLEAYSRYDLASQYEAFNDHANLFHRSLAHLCGNRMIREQLLAIHDKVLVISARYYERGHTVEEARREHAMILRALRERDTTLAEAAVRYHIQGIISLYRQSNAPDRPERHAED